MAAERFEIAIPQAKLDDLELRLEGTQFPLDFVNDDWSYGVPTAYLRDLVAYWLDSFDWRAQERAMNRFDHYRVEVGGAPVHFVHVPGAGPDPLPLILTHGWPWTFWDFRDVIMPLADPAGHGGDAADAFSVVVPSLPGFAFSTPLTRRMAIWEVADLWVELMALLGYERFGAHGGDLGALVTAQLGHRFADRVTGIHLAPRPTRLDIWNVRRPWAELVAGTLPDDAGARDPIVEWEQAKVGHAVANVLDPQTLAMALHDSPAGLAAWLLERRRAWSDCDGDVEAAFPKDDLLTSFTLYWATDSFVTSARLYRENWLTGWRPEHDGDPVVAAPTGVSLFTADLPPGASTDWIGDYYNLRFLREQPRGGHFAAAERPAEIVEDLRSFFRPLR